MKGSFSTKQVRIPSFGALGQPPTVPAEPYFFFDFGELEV